MTCDCCIFNGWDTKDWFGQMEPEPRRQHFQPGLTSGPLPIPFSHSHIGAQTEGNVPLETGGFHQNTSSTFRGGIPSLSTCWPRLSAPPALLPQIAIGPQGTASCNVLFCLSPVATEIWKRFVVPILQKWRHLQSILKILVRVFVYCFDQLFLTCGQNPQSRSKGKDPSRQTRASNKGSLPMDFCPPGNGSYEG